MTVLRRFDAVLEATKQAVLDMKTSLDKAGIVHQDQALRQAAWQAFYNTSKFTLRDLKARASQQQLRADFEDYLDGFSPNVQDILENFEFRNQIPRLSKADALGALIEKLTSPDINLSPDPVLNTDGSVRHEGLDNHAMGTIFEELVRKFNEENNEEAGEHWTPRDAVRLMAKLIFLPVANEIESGTYLLYDGVCGTGGMLTVAEDTLQGLAEDHGKEVATHLYGQEINAETYAICKADLLLKGEGDAADNIVGGPEHSTLSNDAFPSREFDFMLSNPPYGKSWKSDLERMGGKKDMRDPRYIIEHQGDPEYSLVTRSSDGQMLFLVNMISKMKRRTKLGSRIAEVHNGSSLFTGDAGQGESNIRRWIIENDWLEAIVALPLNMFYNTGIATYIWVLSNRKPEHRKGKVQLIDATKWYKPLRKNLGKKNCELSEADIKRICDTFLTFEETEQSKIFANAAFGYWKSTSYSAMQYNMFQLVILKIRGKSAAELACILNERLSDSDDFGFKDNDRFSLHGQNGRPIHRLLARMTDYVETQSGQASHYTEYIHRHGKNGYEVEHIWANHPERHEDEFAHPNDFTEYRNRIGGLLLLPKSFNASYGDKPYAEKREHYYGQNLLAQSLHEKAYDHNPGFHRFLDDSGLPFVAHTELKKNDLDARQMLYVQLAEKIWNPANLLREVQE